MVDSNISLCLSFCIPVLQLKPPIIHAQFYSLFLHCSDESSWRYQLNFQTPISNYCTFTKGFKILKQTPGTETLPYITLSVNEVFHQLLNCPHELQNVSCKNGYCPNVPLYMSYAPISLNRNPMNHKVASQIVIPVRTPSLIPSSIALALNT